MNSIPVKNESTRATSFLDLPEGRRIAYALSEGKGPCVVFMGGFKSDMSGSKAMALESYCRERGQRFLRFDYSGHGQSSGDFEEGTLGAWKRDALDVLDRLAGEKYILVGSSMGAWLALLSALERKEKLLALVGVASAPDFTERLIWDAFSDAQKKQMLDNGVLHLPSCYGEPPYPITLKLVEDGRHHLLLDGPIALDAPVRLIHGDLDEDVPWQVSVKLMNQLTSQDVRLTLVKAGNHRLSDPAQLALLSRTVEELLSHCTQAA